MVVGVAVAVGGAAGSYYADTAPGAPDRGARHRRLRPQLAVLDPAQRRACRAPGAARTGRRRPARARTCRRRTIRTSTATGCGHQAVSTATTPTSSTRATATPVTPTTTTSTDDVNRRPPANAGEPRRPAPDPAAGGRRRDLRTWTSSVRPSRSTTTCATTGDRIGLTTVYRTLQPMVDAGELDALRTADGETAYRRCSNGHHHHLVCRTCGRTVEVSGPAVEKWATADRRGERLPRGQPRPRDLRDLQHLLVDHQVGLG